MKKTLISLLAASAAVITLNSALAAPSNLIIINNSSTASNAMINGDFSPPEYVAQPGEAEVFAWSFVRDLCHNTLPATFGGDVCAAEIYADVNGTAPVDVGTVTINLDTGVIYARNNANTGYKIVPNPSALGVVELEQQTTVDPT